MKTEKNVIAAGGYTTHPLPLVLPYYADNCGGLLEAFGTSPLTLFPMKFGDNSFFQPDTVYPVLQNITLAAEAGMLTTHNWPQQLFDSKLSFDCFIEALREWPGRMSDRVWYALSLICDHDEGGFCTHDEIASVLWCVAFRDCDIAEGWGD